MIEAVGLVKRFGDFTAVNRIDLNVTEGEVMALLGPNGAGKTTTVRLLASILKPTEGHARIAGHDTHRDAEVVRRAVGLLTELPGLYPRMTGWDYLDFFGQLQGLDKEQRETRGEELLKKFEMWEAKDRLIGKYSKGMRQKLTLIRAMLHDPLVLFLDEPTSAMDPHSARLVRDAIKQLRGEKRTILLCTHNLNEAEELADRIAIIRRGEIIAQGTPAQLKQQFLGLPIMEVRLAHHVDGAANEVARIIEVESQGETWIRYRTPDPLRSNPAVIAKLASIGASVVSLGEVTRSLEEVYLRIVEE